MRNAGLEEAQAGIKIAGRNINKDVSLSELQEFVMYREAWHATIYGVSLLFHFHQEAF